MKIILTIWMVLLFAGTLSAQTWDELFHQKKTQKKYLIQQIAALQVYASYLSKGYAIAREGMGIVGDLKQGDFSLHNDHFNSLLQVSPAIKKYVKVAAIIAMQISMTKQAKKALQSFSGNKQFSVTELGYLKTVVNNLLTSLAGNLDELTGFLTNGNLQLTDNGRLKAIDRLYADQLDKQTFLQSFITETVGLSVQRINEANDIATLKTINGIK